MATILFADLVGSTALGEELDPEYARDLLERFYDAMEAEIALGGGRRARMIRDRRRSASATSACRRPLLPQPCATISLLT